MENYLTINRESWNHKVDGHVASDFYEMEAFLKGKTSLKEIEIGLLGDVKNKSILHLQCHFGQDSLSLARMGANVTGVDLSDVAIAKAKAVNDQLNLNTKFIAADVYDLPNHLEDKYDIVYTSYGVIGWLPDMDKWAKTIAHFLKPGGKLVFVEFHPFVWMYDDDITKITFSYFKEEAIVGAEDGSYADQNKSKKYQYVCWNHGLAEVMTALMNNGISIEHFQEYNYSPYNCLAKMEEVGESRYQLKPFGNKVPLCYSIVGGKRLQNI